MADTSLATIEKNLVWQQIEQILGKMNTPSRSKEWRISQDKKVSVFVTFSKIHNSSRTAWYDINVHKLNDWLQYPKAYIIFVVDTHQNTFVIPAIKLKEEMDKSKRQPTDLGNIDIHIKKDPEFYISEYQHFDLMNYHLTYHHLSTLYTIASGDHTIKEASKTYEIEEGEDITPGEVYYEGATMQITVNVYERNAEARRKCIQHYGSNCSICNFDFKKVYGQIGEGFVHVHHLKPLSEIASTYILDPIKDLRPVCPNCHAILHRRKPAYSIEDIKNMINGNL